MNTTPHFVRQRFAAGTGVLWFFLVSGCVTPGGGAEEPKPMIRTPASAAGAPAAAVARLTERSCAATYTLTEGNRGGTDEFFIGSYPEPGRNEELADFPAAAAVQSFIDRNLDLLTVDGHAVDTRCEVAGGDCHAAGREPTCRLAVVRTVKSLAEAQQLARACNQRVIGWLRFNGTRFLDNGGKGYGDGQKLGGPALDACRKARGD